MKKITVFFGLVALLTLYFFYESRTQHFRLQDILTTLPSVSNLEKVPVPELQQRFYYLGSGKQCHAFLGEDHKTVLKFFRHNDLSFESLLKKWSVPLEHWYGKFFIRYNPESVLKSCQLAYEVLPEETGIFYLHFHRTTGVHGKVQLIDRAFVGHEVDLDETEFILQHYGELAIARIERQMKEGNLEGAASSVEALIEAAAEWRRKGVHVQHPAFRRNVGFCKDRVMLLDAGSLQQLSLPQTPTDVLQEIHQVTARLRRWIYKKHPALSHCYQSKVAEFET